MAGDALAEADPAKMRKRARQLRLAVEALVLDVDSNAGGPASVTSLGVKAMPSMVGLPVSVMAMARGY